MSPEDVAFYQDRIGQGGIVVAVSDDARVDGPGVDAIMLGAGGMRAAAPVAP